MSHEKIPLIHISNLNYYYGDRVLFEYLSHEIYSGDICLITGPSGVGKTTLLSLIGGIIALQGGEIRYDPTLLPRQNGFGYAFIDGPFFEDMSVLDNILLLENFADTHIDRDYLQELLEYWEIEMLVSQTVVSLSVGQRERVNFVRALAHKPRIVILDEPGANLDTRLFMKLIEYIRGSGRDTAYVIVSHDQRFLSLASTYIELTSH